MKIVKIQNEMKVISSLKPEDIKKLVKAGKNVLHKECRPVYGVNFSETTASFTGKSVTFNQVSDSGYAMLTVECCPTCTAGESDEAIIRSFAENYLEAINNLKAAEPEFTASLETLNGTIDSIIDSAMSINID